MPRLTLGFCCCCLAMATLLLAGCSSGGTPPVTERSRVDHSTERQVARNAALTGNNYRVVAGDTLYSIAWRYQRDFRDLAALNRIPAPFEIYPGQVLTVKGQAARRPVTKRVSPAAQSNKPHPLASTRTKPQSGAAISSSTGSVKATSSPKPSVAAKPPAAKPARPAKKIVAPSTGPVPLRWPSSGKRLLAAANKTGSSIDFALQPGTAIRAAGPGEVVFAQASLAGYRQFVILKHNDTWLSSYGFNAPLQVSEGQHVVAGTTLATLPRGGGNGSPNERVLRFEVRKNGTAVNPDTVVTR